MTDACRILLISGSLRVGSTNTAALATAHAIAPRGVETTLYEGLARLPHFNPDDDPDGGPVHEAVAELRAVLGYTGAEIVEPACARITLGRAAIGPDRLIADLQIQAEIARVLTALAEFIEHAAAARP